MEGIVINKDFNPDFWAVYVIHDPVMGYFAGYKPFGICIPMWCATINGAKVFDAFRDITARVAALDTVNYHHTEMKNSKVICYRRCDFYPDEYR